MIVWPSIQVPARRLLAAAFFIAVVDGARTARTLLQYSEQLEKCKNETRNPNPRNPNPKPRERERDCETALRCRSPRGVVTVIVRELRLWTAVPCLPLRLLHLLFSPRARTPRGQQHHRGCTGAAGSLAVRVRDGDERERECGKGGEDEWTGEMGRRQWTLKCVFSVRPKFWSLSPRTAVLPAKFFVQCH